MKLITVEEHFDTTANIEQFNQFSQVPNNNPFQSALNHDLTDFDSHVAYMDKYGIDMQVIFDAGNSPQVLPDDLVVAACQVQNDSLAQSISSHPDRFAGLAVLPANKPAEAAKELERAVTQLGLKGGVISGSVNGQFLDDPKFEPIFAKASELDVPLYLHPGVISEEQKSVLYDSKGYSAMTATLLAGAGWGWHQEQGIQMVRLIMSGLMEKYPNLKLVSGHWGEMVPMFLERVTEFMQISDTKLPHEFQYYYKRNVYVTPSGMLTAPQLALVKTEMGADHMMYAEDYPYVKREDQLGKFIENADLTDDEREKMAHGTAEKLFNL